MAAKVFVTTLSLLIIYDILLGIYHENIDIPYIMTNVISNVIGALFIVIFFLFNLGIIFKISEYWNEQCLFRRLIYSIVILGSGVFVSIFAFWSLDVLYNPIPAKIDAVLEAPVSGILAAPEADELGQAVSDNQQGPFRLISDAATNGLITWRGIAELRATWQGEVPFDAIVSVYADCARPEDIEKVSAQAPRMTIHGLQRLEVRASDGYAEFGFLNRNAEAKATVETTNVTQFGLDRDGAGKTLIRQFIGDRGAVRFETRDLPTKMYLTAIFVGDDPETMRDIKIIGGKSVYELLVSSSNKGKMMECRGLDATKTLKKGGNSDRMSSGGAVGLLVELVSSRSPSTSYLVSATLDITGEAGWIHAAGLSDDQLQAMPNGALRLLGFVGSVANFDINGEIRQLSLFDEVVAIGDLEGGFQSQGRLRISGTAKALWKKGRRFIPTKWETWDWDLRLLVFSIIFGVGLSVGRIALGVFKDSPEIRWSSL
ncbi:hypothetical protein [Rhodoligotrophos defluvii]|uniref:hypothetical protein n=1 Tax=Rhodoligotrophos defluvii TaxID=2561934 RepID=UPI0010C9FC8E|nr:hypothetical protein [Rhodoligotrophos defluvii]